MKRTRSIQVKALFLLAVFSLNTLVGFACAAGLNMGFNAKHHHHEEDAVSPAKGHPHHEGAAHHHDEEASTAQKAGEDNNCCNDGVIKFSQADKLLAHAVNAGLELPVMLVHLHFLYESYLSSCSYGHGQSLPVPRLHVAGSRGIRVSIQSFQI